MLLRGLYFSFIYCMPKLINISGKSIGKNQPVFIIAEAGVNHNGRLDLALKLIDEAAKAGADAIKFQTFRAEQVVTVSGKMADYQKRNIGKTESQLAMLKKLELKEKYYPALIRRAKELGIIFLSTPHGGFESVDFLQKMKVPAFKFGSGDLTNHPLLEYAAKFKKPMVVSTGMSTLKEVETAVKAIKKIGNNKIAVLHCTTNYPTPLDEVNLLAMKTMEKKLGLLIGYSDHTEGLKVSVAAAVLGARIIEKHFTLDKNLSGPDHLASLNPQELKLLVSSIRNVEKALGSGKKVPFLSEKKVAKIARKSLVTIRAIKKGEKFTLKNLGIKRPGIGLPPKYFDKVLGKKAKKDIPADTLINL